MIEENLGRSLRRLRTQQRVSLRRLAAASGFSASFLSQVEHGLASPSISSMERIASALGVTLAQFFTHAEDKSSAVIHATDRSRLSMEWSSAEVEALGVLGSGSHLYAILVKLDPGGMSGKHPRSSPNDEFAFIYRGSAVLTLDADDHLLKQGDSAVIPSGAGRRWRNESRRPVQILIVSARPAR
jgi:transcriptional regulator with XRE-family HTH domain